jgi:hypothetical protein
MWKSFVLELHGEWPEFADECIGLLATVEPNVTCQESRLYRHLDCSRSSLGALAIMQSSRRRTDGTARYVRY